MAPAKKRVKKNDAKSGEAKPAVKKRVTKKAVAVKSGEANVKYAIEGRFIHVRLGDEFHPASKEEIEELTGLLEDMMELKGINCIVFVTHYGVFVDVHG